MLMRDHPIAVKLVEANCRSPPHVELRSVGPRSTNMAEAVGEREGLRHRDTFRAGCPRVLRRIISYCLRQRYLN